MSWRAAVQVAVAAAVEPVTDDAAAAGRASGPAPASAAYAASLLGSGQGWDQDTIAWAALTGPTPRLVSSCGAKSVTRSARWRLLSASSRFDPADGEGEAAALGAVGTARSRVSALTAAAAGDGSEPVGRQRAAGQRTLAALLPVSSNAFTD